MKQKKLVVGSPLPNAGEGLGGEGETSMPRPETLNQQNANIRSLIPRAQELRHSDTLAEKLAWKLLRNRQVLHYKFRRQVPLGNAIVDFCCLSLKLVVELDGAGHAQGSQATRDRRRDREIEKRGYRVLRFPNGIVLKAPTEFVKKIQECIDQLEHSSFEGAASVKLLNLLGGVPLTPSPSPALGRGEPNSPLVVVDAPKGAACPGDRPKRYRPRNDASIPGRGSGPIAATACQSGTMIQGRGGYS